MLPWLLALLTVTLLVKCFSMLLTAVWGCW